MNDAIAAIIAHDQSSATTITAAQHDCFVVVVAAVDVAGKDETRARIEFVAFARIQADAGAIVFENQQRVEAIALAHSEQFLITAAQILTKGDVLEWARVAAARPIHLAEVGVGLEHGEFALILVDEGDIISTCAIQIADGNALPVFVKRAQLMHFPRRPIGRGACLLVDDHGAQIARVWVVGGDRRADNANFVAGYIRVEITGKDQCRTRRQCHTEKLLPGNAVDRLSWHDAAPGDDRVEDRQFRRRGGVWRAAHGDDLLVAVDVEIAQGDAAPVACWAKPLHLLTGERQIKDANHACTIDVDKFAAGVGAWRGRRVGSAIFGER